MKRVAVDWKEPSRPPWWAWLPVLALAVAAMVYGARAYSLRQELAAAQARLKLAQDDAQPKPARELAALPVPPYDASARQFLKERQAIWPQALRALENLPMRGLMVQMIDFNGAEDSVRVEVNAPDHATVATLVRELNVGNSGLANDLHWSLARSQANANGGGVLAQLRCARGRQQ